MAKNYDVLIVGGGVSGTSLLYTLSKYTNIKKIGLIEKYSKLAQVNSKGTSNSQTLHFGDIETNYTPEKAEKVKEDANYVKNYLEDYKKKNDKKIFSKYHKMVLAVGTKEVEELHKRYPKFKKIFPELKEIKRNEIKRLEPRVMQGRDPSEEVLALYSPNGYTIDYGALSQSFVFEALKLNKSIEINLKTKLSGIKKVGNHYLICTNKGNIKAKVVVVATGVIAYLLLIN